MLTNKSYGKKMMPEYLINFVRDIYEGPVPLSFGRSLVKEANIKKLETYYKLFKGTAKKNYGERMVPNYLLKYIEKLVNADYIEYVDDLVAYIKETPQKALKYGFLNKVGGMSYESENLIVIADVEETTVNGITWKVENGFIYLNGTSTAQVNIWLSIPTIISGKTITFKDFGDMLIYPNNTIQAYLAKAASNYGDRFQLSNNGIFYSGTTSFDYPILQIFVGSGSTLNNAILKPMIVKGTTEPTEFKKGYEGIRDSLVTSVNSKELTANEEKYGWGIDATHYNYRDYDNNKGHQLVVKIPLKDLDFATPSNPASGVFRAFLPSSVKKSASGTIPCIAKIYEYSPFAWAPLSAADNMCFGINDITNPDPVRISIINSSYVDNLQGFIDSIQDKYLYALIDEEAIEDIDSIDNVIDVSSGELKFNNEYEQAVPSEVTYYVEA